MSVIMAGLCYKMNNNSKVFKMDTPQPMHFSNPVYDKSHRTRSSVSLEDAYTSDDLDNAVYSDPIEDGI